MKLRKQIHFTADRKVKHHNFELNGKWMNTKFKHSQQASSKKEPKKTKSLILFLITYLENHGHYFLRIQKKTQLVPAQCCRFLFTLQISISIIDGRRNGLSLKCQTRKLNQNQNNKYLIYESRNVRKEPRNGSSMLFFYKE